MVLVEDETRWAVVVAASGELEEGIPASCSIGYFGSQPMLGGLPSRFLARISHQISSESKET